MLDEALGICQRASGDLAGSIAAASTWRDATRTQIDGGVVEPLQTAADTFTGVLTRAAPVLGNALARLHE